MGHPVSIPVNDNFETDKWSEGNDGEHDDTPDATDLIRQTIISSK